jgi:hypothetical protein
LQVRPQEIVAVLNLHGMLKVQPRVP